MTKFISFALATLLCLVASPQVYPQYMPGEGSDTKGEKSKKLQLALQFRNVGPTRGGRVTTVRGVVNNPQVFYMGTSGGGLWKTSDYGIHWKNISDGYFLSPSIGAIAIYQENPEIIYVGSGSDGIRSNVIVGKGIYKSIDGGVSWKHLGLEDAGQIGAVEIHPKNPDMVIVAVIGQPFRKSSERGVYRTSDGGTSWKQVLFLSDSVGAVDIEFAPDNPDIVYASMWRGERKPWTIISGGAEDGIFKSGDGGKTWQRKTSGLPEKMTGKIDFAVSPDKPGRVWAQIQASKDEEGIYRSDNYAETWVKVSLPEEDLENIMFRPFYFTNLSVNPRDADQIWSGAKQLYKSFDGGESWSAVQSPHMDFHDLWIHPQDTSLMIQGNDGGASISRDGGVTWSTVFNQPTAELYSCNVDDRYPYYLYSGQQDNSTICVPVRQPGMNVLSSKDNPMLNDMMYWERVGGCETGPAVPKPGDPNIVYTNCKGKFSVFSRITGSEQLYYVGAESLYGNHPSDVTFRFQRVTPIEVSPHNPEIVYYGSQYLHKTSDGGKTWETISPDLTANREEFRMRSGGPIAEDITGEENYAVLYAIQESPVTAGIIWTGSNDGMVHITMNNGKTWKNVTPHMQDGGRVSNIDVSSHNPAKAYLAINRDYLGDDHPYFYRTNDFGQNWTLLSGTAAGIPDDYPARVVREDPHREGLLYAGTEFGLFISFNDGLTWKPFQRNLPVTPVTDLRIKSKDLVLSTMGRSFWVMDDISPLHEIDPEGGDSPVLYTPRNVMDESFNAYFTLPEASKDDTITISFYRDGSLIYSIQDTLKNFTVDGLGLYKKSWNQSYYLPDGKEFLRGPRVAPGTYQVRLTFRETTLEKSFKAQMNPNLKSTGLSIVDLIEQEELSLDVAKLLLEIRSEIRILEGAIEKTKRGKREKLTASLSELKKEPGVYDQPKLQDHVEYLYKMLTSTRQKPGKDAFDRWLTLQESWSSYKGAK